MIILQNMKIELIGEIPLYLGVGIQIVAAIILGGMVGYDREKKMKAAGLKTNILICLGATLYTAMSVLYLDEFSGTADPNRVGAQIVSGIGFLGAGAIIQGRGNVVGMTTAATIWVVAAIGYTIGLGYPVSAAFFSITVLFVLKWINPVYRFLENEKGEDTFHVEALAFGSVKKSVMELVRSEDIEIDEVYEEEIDHKRRVLTLYLIGHVRTMDRLITDVKAIASVERVSFHQVNFDHSEMSKSKKKENLLKTGDEK